MMPINTKIISTFIDYKANNKDGSLKSVKCSEDLFANIIKPLNSVPKKSSHGVDEHSRTGLSFKEERFHFYLESLKKALLSKGKPLNKVSLKNDDLSLFKKFLFECGLSQKKVDRLLKDLLENNPRGEINLSRFFQKITELVPPKSKNQHSYLLDPAAIPHVELILRNFGMTPRELDRVFSAARIEDGRLDLEKFVVKLRKITKEQSIKTSLTTVQKLDHQLADRLKMLGVHIPEQGRNGQISLKDFISSLEQMVGKPDVEHGLPAEVKTTMEHILAKVVISDEKTEPAIFKSFVSDSKHTDLYSHEKIASNGEPVEKEKLLSSLKDKGKPTVNDVLLSPFSEKDKAVDKKNLSFSIKETVGTEKNEKLPAKLNGGQDLKHEVKKGSHAFKSETRTVNVFQQMTGSTASETVHNVKQNDSPQNFMSTYLIDQVGRQISRAILKGDRVIRLQLRPPELGAVKIEMDIKDNVLRLGIITENSLVKELLLSNIHELRDALMEKGVKIEKLDVQVNHDFNQSLANSKEDLKERQRFIEEQDKSLLVAEDNMDDRVSGPWNRASDDRLLNLVA